MNRTHSFAALCLAVLAPAVHATPDVLGYAARVENDAGPFNGTVSATFELFAAPTGGNPLFDEDIASLIVVDGTMVHDIGSEEPLDDSVLQRDGLFLQVTLNGEVLQPRVALRAVPYALHAREADSLQGLSAEDLVTQPQLSAFRPRFQDLQNIPAGLSDGDQDTLFTAASNGGLALSGTAFSMLDGAVTTARLANDAVTATKLAAGAVASRNYAPGSIQAAHIAPGTIGSGQLGSNSVTTSQLQDNSVTSSKIVNGTIQGADLASSTITSVQLQNNSVSLFKIAVDSVDRTRIVGDEVALFRVANFCTGEGSIVTTGNCAPPRCPGTSLFLSCSGQCSATTSQLCTNQRIGFLLAP